MTVAWSDQDFRDARDLARRVALRRGCSADDAEDVAQETLLELLRQVRAGNQIREVRAYTAITAANKHREDLRSTIRREQRELRVAHGDRQVSTNPARPGVRRAALHAYDLPTDRIENAHLVEAILEQLTAAQRAAVLLIFIACLTTAEAARVLGTTSQAVTANIRRARDHLRWLFDTDYYLQRQLSGDYDTRVNLEGAILNGHNLSGRSLVGANLVNTDLAGADLTFADCTDADLTGANLSEAQMTGTILIGAVLKRARIEDADLTRATLTRATLTDACLRGSTFAEAVLTDAHLFRCDLRRASLVSVKAQGALLSMARLTKADLHNADLRRADLSGASLSEADLTDADLTDASLRNADLAGADLSFANATGTDFTAAILSGANFTGANVTNTNLPSEESAQQILAALKRRAGWDGQGRTGPSGSIRSTDESSTIRYLAQLLASLAGPAEALQWKERARCAGVGSELFFPDGGDTRRAKAFCGRCPVWDECLAHGLYADHGVWGGLNRAERAGCEGSVSVWPSRPATRPTRPTSDASCPWACPLSGSASLPGSTSRSSSAAPKPATHTQNDPPRRRRTPA